MIQIEPITTVSLFSKLNAELIKLVSTFNQELWFKETACEGWCVKDIFQHMLKDYTGIISRKRDQFQNPFSKNKGADVNFDLVSQINQKNQAWVEVSRSFSPQLLIELYSFVGKKVVDYYNTVSLDAIEAEVSWIGSSKVPNWVDIAREYTEQWLHQAHIREAVGVALLSRKEFFTPLIHTYMLALPKTYDQVIAPQGTSLNVVVSGDSGGSWGLERLSTEWCLRNSLPVKEAVAQITLDQDLVWRLFSKQLTKQQVVDKVLITGDRRLGEKVLDTVSLIA